MSENDWVVPIFSPFFSEGNWSGLGPFEITFGIYDLHTGALLYSKDINCVPDEFWSTIEGVAAALAPLIKAAVENDLTLREIGPDPITVLGFEYLDVPTLKLLAYLDVAQMTSLGMTGNEYGGVNIGLGGLPYQLKLVVIPDGPNTAFCHHVGGMQALSHIVTDIIHLETP